MYAIPSGFLKDLKLLDKRLDCVFDDYAQKFLITYKRANGQPHNVLFIENEEGNFRYPDQRDIKILKDGMIFESGNARQWLDKVTREMEERQNNEELATKEYIRLATIDNKNQLMNAFLRAHNMGEYAVYRKVAPKPKGKIFK